MRVSENWLREWIDPGVGTQQLADILTMAGLEVDGVEFAAPMFSGVVIAKVIKVEPHPDAKKLHICQVDDGKGEVSNVICGANNVRKGLIVAFAKVGAVLPNDFKIEPKELRGVESFGMLCSPSELGLTESSQGILELPEDAKLGVDVYSGLDLADKVIDIDLTPNRSDCLSVQGVAREVSALLDKPLQKNFTIAEVKATIKSVLPVSIKAKQECPRYVGRVIEGVTGSVQSPLWMQEKLRRAGVRAINAITDIINFVMLEMGQPMHAFDLDTLNGGVVVRFANKAEKLELLDGQTVELSEDELVIADEKQAVALAGIMGGQETAIQHGTARVFLESASFKPEIVAGKARRYGLHTDSSHRFERGVDPNLATQAIERATQLILELVGGEAGPVIFEEDLSELPKPVKILLEHSKVESLLGIKLAVQKVQSLLVRLQCKVEVEKNVLHVQPPSYRFDLKIDVDLIEEVARLVGYENIPADVKALAINTTLNIEANQLGAMKGVLVSRGYHEVITFSFVAQEIEELFNDGNPSKQLANPISQELSVMRSSAWPGLLKAAQHNLHRQQPRIRIFEQALQFKNTTDGLKQSPSLSGLIVGDCEPEQWGSMSRRVDFYDLKGDVEHVLKISSLPIDRVSFLPAEDAALHPGQSAKILFGDVVIGRLGKLHPRIQSAIDIDSAVYLFELQLNELIKKPAASVFQALSKYPSIRRDITMIVNDNVNAAEIRSNIEQMNIACLQCVEVFSVYKGEGISESKKSVSLSLILQEFSRTLTDKEIEQTVLLIISQLENKVGAEIRS
ncbi:MAG: phenylalanine--tRNA ligase subunit beta [Gammaproteobacteria bacterium]|nr:MAG: phenylalanine--tRNA ligase subunit beta [Gammaproteobacteria bacterium]